MKKIILEEQELDLEPDREILLEDDELTPEEEAFMRGYEEAG